MKCFDPSEADLNFIQFLLLVEKLLDKIEINSIQHSYGTEKIFYWKLPNCIHQNWKGKNTRFVRKLFNAMSHLCYWHCFTSLEQLLTTLWFLLYGGSQCHVLLAQFHYFDKSERISHLRRLLGSNSLSEDQHVCIQAHWRQDTNLTDPDQLFLKIIKKPNSIC